MRKFLSVILVLLLCPIILGQIAASSARALLRDPAFAKEIMRESGVYSQMESFLADRLTEGLDGTKIEFTGAEMTRIMAGLIPAERIQSLAEPLVDGFYGWFWSGAPRPELILDLTAVRSAFPGAIRPIIMDRVAALPPCSARQEAQLEASSEGGKIPCKPSSAGLDRIVERISSEVPLERLLPSHVDLAAALEQQNGPTYWTDMRADFQEVRTGLDLIPYGWVGIVLLLALLAVLNLDRWYTPFGWMAAPLLIAGSIMLILGILGPVLAKPLIANALEGSDAMDSTVMAGIQLAMGGLFNAMRTLSIVTVLVGLCCVVTGRVGRRRSSVDVGPRSGVA